MGSRRDEHELRQGQELIPKTCEVLQHIHDMPARTPRSAGVLPLDAGLGYTCAFAELKSHLTSRFQPHSSYPRTAFMKSQGDEMRCGHSDALLWFPEAGVNYDQRHFELDMVVARRLAVVTAWSLDEAT